MCEQSFAQSDQCLIVKQNKGHRVRNVFLFGAYGLFSRGERFEYVESFNFDHWQMKYKGEELQHLQQTSGLHIVVVSEGSADEIQTARASCHELMNDSQKIADSDKPGDSKPVAKKKTCNSDHPMDCWWNPTPAKK